MYKQSMESVKTRNAQKILALKKPTIMPKSPIHH